MDGRRERRGEKKNTVRPWGDFYAEMFVVLWFCSGLVFS